MLTEKSKEYALKFLNAEMDGSGLLSLADNELMEMGIDRKVHRARLLSELKKPAIREQLTTV